MRFLRRRWRWIAGVCVACVAIVTLYWMVASPRYEATGEVEIQKQQSSPLGLTAGGSGANAGSTDALDYDVTLQTQVDILKSDTLALKVIEQLGLEKTKAFFGGKPSLFRRGLAFWRRPLEPLSVPLEDAPDRRYAALKIFHKNLQVYPVSGTRLIRISYVDGNPERAAAVVNALIQALMGYGFEARYEATTQATGWLSGQLTDLKKQTEALQARAVALQRATGMFGDDEQNNIMLSRLEALNKTLAADEANRILKGAIYQTAESSDPEMISDLSGNAADSTGVQNSLELIQNLRTNEAVVNAKIAEDSKRYGPQFPEMAELESERASLGKSIAKEVKRLGERAHTDYLIAERAEAGARADFERQKQLVNELNSKAVQYSLVKQEADDSRNLYESLLGKLKEAGVLAGLDSTNLQVVNPARVPPVDHPKSPSFPKDEGIGLAGGLVLGFGAALFAEMTDERLHGRTETEELLGQRVLAVIPEVGERRKFWAPNWMRGWQMARGREGIALTARVAMPVETRARLNEPFRLLRTAMQGRGSERKAQVILVTSPVGGEGKSTVAAQLARAFAWQKARVLLVEADFRSADAAGDAAETHGLSGELQGEKSAGKGKAVRRDATLPNLVVLPRGAAPEFPAELLGAERMRELVEAWRREYDYVVMDGPAYLPVADAAVLAQQSDVALLVLRERQTLRGDAEQCMDMLRRQLPEGAEPGVVLNGVRLRKGGAAYARAS
jgi:capsular exopolysaccharide synthesis family protein